MRRLSLILRLSFLVFFFLLQRAKSYTHCVGVVVEPAEGGTKQRAVGLLNHFSIYV